MDEEETEHKYQCASCGQWFEEDEMVGEVCQDCYVIFFSDANEQ